MLAKELKRCLSFLLALVMVFSMVPVQAFAAEEEHDHDGEIEAIVEGQSETDTTEADAPAEPAPVLDEHTHAYDSAVTAATCTKDGYTTYTCQCGHSYTEEIKATGHSYETKVVEPTYEAEGYTEYTCAVCGDSYRDIFTDMLIPEETTEPEASEPVGSGSQEAPSALASDLAQMINEVLATFKVTSGMSDEEIKAAIKAQPWAVQKNALNQISQIEAMVEEITDADAEYVVANADAETFFRFRDVMRTVNPVMRAASGTHKPVTGVAVSVSGASDNSMSSGAVTVTAKGSGGILGFGASAKTATIKIANDSSSKAKISFDWTASSVNQLKIDGTVYSGASGSFEKVMEAGESFTVTITTAKNSTVNKLVMKNFACAAVKDSSKVTFQYDNTMGSITVAGEAVAAGSQLDVASAGAELKATAASGVTFLGWIDADTHVLLSNAASFTLEPAADMTVKAVFTKNACFLVNGNALYEGLNEALEAVQSVNNKVIVLANSGTLPAGTYTIPSGVTLLIPYNDANTLCTTAPTTANTTFTEPKAYRTLTMANGANIVINGALSLSATQSASGGISSPIGNCSFIQMESGSSITVNNRGNLYAWGYIQGSGAVTVEKGGTVYECFQVMDWRGGDNTSGMVGNDQRVFPMSQYYVQNIEVPMTLKAGATENGYMSVSITLVGIQGCAVPFIGSNGMFNITSGHIVKDYDENTGRLLIDMHGNLSVKSLSLSMKLGLLGSSTINSKDYVLPINGNMTVTMHNGSAVTMTQDIALQPGAKLIIKEGATCTLGNGNKIYVYDYDEWITREGTDATTGEGPSFCGTADATHVNLKYPTSAKTVQGRTEDAYVEVNGTVDTSAGYVYTTASGANICGTGTIIMKPGTEKVTYQIKDLKQGDGDEKQDKWFEIPITSAKLRNADDSFTVTADDLGKVTYKSVNGVWTCEHTYAAGTFKEEVTTPATCEAAGVKTLTCNCGEKSKTEGISALGHDYEVDVTPPTCTEDGYTTHTCKNGCNDSYTDTPVAAKGHTEVIDAKKEPTCVETGLTEGKHCSVCNKVLVAQEVVDALGHTEVTDAAVAPTCTETGLTEGKHCSVCNEVLVAQTKVDAKGHTAGTAATCTEAQTCTVCGAELATALGHTEVVDKAVAPTCTETGLTEGKHCSVCNEVLVAQTKVDAKGHTAGAAATCTTAQTCTVCGAELVAKLGHTEVTDAAVAPTCTETGLTEGKHCSVCNEVLVAQTKVDAKGHTEVVDEAVAPTCTETGLTEGKHCSVCGHVITAQKVEPALDHKWEWVTDKPATVLETGIRHEECTRCHEKRSENTEIPMLTCAHTGTLTVTEAKDPACTEAGNSLYSYCSACQNYYSDRSGQHKIEKDSWVIEAKGHTEAIDAAVNPTCTETGLTEGKHCSVCNEVLVAQTKVDAKGHTAGAAATCTTAQTCTVCGAELVAKLGHKEVIDEAKDPDCDNTGLTEGKHCSVCGHVFTAQEMIPALGHTYVEHEEHVFHCERCGDSFVQGITEIVGTVTDESAEEEIAQAVEKIQNMETEQLAAVMKDETVGKNVVEQIEKLENHVETQVNVEVKNNTSYAPENVTIIGAKLNKVKNQSVGITLRIDEAKTDVQIPDDSYNVRSAVKFSMTLMNVQNTENLEVPVQIKLPVPENLNAEKLTVLHFNTNGTVKETIVPAISENNGQKYASFVISSFSDFALAENHKHAYTEVVTAPTCTTNGFTTCTCDCGDVFTKDEVVATGHHVEEVAAVDATCQKEGNVAHWHCTVCGENFSDAEAKKPLESVVTPVAPENHTFAEEPTVNKATCKAEGSLVYPCVNEGCKEAVTETLEIDPEGHVWDEGEPYGNHNCNSSSYTKYTCTLCDETLFELVREQHFRVPIGEEIPATCTTDGMTSGMKCEKCDAFWVPQEVIPALGHDWDGNYPCQNDTSACTRCDLSFDSKQEHQIVVIPAVPATCTATGLSEGSYCEICGETLVEQTELPLADHDWIVADMEVPARCGVVGHKEGSTYCLVCEYDEDPIPALNHQWMHRDAKLATYTAVGYNDHDYCLLCNVTKTKEQYEGNPCEFCGENPEGYVEIPKKEVVRNKDLENFVDNIEILEMIAYDYAMKNPGADPLALVLNYMRTAVSNYTSGSWAIMAGPEDKDFLKYVQMEEDSKNGDPEAEGLLNVSGLKQLKSYENTHGEKNIYNNKKVAVMSGHFFGTMDMTYHNKGSQNHADVGGWVGDLTDLLSTTDEFGVPADLTFEEKVTYIRNNYLFNDNQAGAAGAFGSNDLYADLDGYYFMNELINGDYEHGDLAQMMRDYYQPGLTLKQRVSYLLNNRLDGLSTRKDLRTAVYNVYTSNKLIATLEGTRNFNAKGDELTELRKAVCYAFADEMCRLAGDYVEDLTNDRFTIFDSETKILAPGISQQINYATNADGKQIVYYVATGDVNREDVDLWVNYYDRDPGTPDAPIWKNNSVPSSAQNAQDRYGDPASEDYIENFNVVVSTNAGGYDMSDIATPGGLMVMNGVEWYPQTNTAGFFAILDDGTAYMGTHDEYESMMAAGRIKEAIGGFGEFVVKDGKVVGSTTYSDAPRTSVGITSTGRVVIMCIDGRQAPFSSGASLQDVGYIMKEAGCVIAINLDGGGSTTFVARQPGSDELTIMNRPSDGYPRNVSTNLLIYSTAPSSTAFDHAVIESEYDYATIGTPVQMTAAGVSPSGNAVDVPEGATWSVSSEDRAAITEDGVFTGKTKGEVAVYLMLDGQIIGSKQMTIEDPDQLYFEREKVDAIYGSRVQLPLRARFEGKHIAINPNDVAFTLSASAAGTMDGFVFCAAESTVKSLSITAAIGKDIKASINVMLYKQGENSFDFDNATGGDRNLAWHREVSNSNVEDGNIYNVIDPSKDMVTSYTFALDMTTIPVPERLEELTYMLPGGTIAGTNAWTYLMSLAQRISDLSWVQATIDFDDRFVVDYSQLEILNEYFEQKGQVEYDEATNTLTVTMNWIKQSQVIDEATANPLCLIKGIKLTPKAGVWEDVSKIDAVTSGTIGYEIYMRASGLYGFAQKPESQAVFGLYPYRNPADTSDAGGYFKDTYADITDTYTLVNVLKEGWVNEDGGFAYYVNGKRLTGIQKVEGYYYDFGEKGVNVGQTKLTGLFFDEQDQVYRYSYIGELADGWQSVGDDWYYFKNFEAVSGENKVGGVKFQFEQNGKLVSGVWVPTLNGVRYYYGPSYYSSLWHEIDGEMYYFKSGNRVTGYHYIGTADNKANMRWQEFDKDGKFQGIMSGLYDVDGQKMYVIDGKPSYGLTKLGDDYYFFLMDGIAVTGSYYAWETKCDLPIDRYEFGADGRMLQGFVEKDNGYYYYVNGKAGREYGLMKIDGDYYFVLMDGTLITNQSYYAWETRCDLPIGRYNFDAEGKLASGIVEMPDGYYYYENGRVSSDYGLINIDGDYYFVLMDGKLITDRIYYAWNTKCDLPMANYEFGADGKMLQGIVEKSDGYYYYTNGKAGGVYGLLKIDDDYYFVLMDGKLITNCVYYAWNTKCDLPMANYEFGADGKMLQGIVEKSDGYYYYTNGKAGGVYGLLKIDDDYYFVLMDGKLITNSVYYAWNTKCDLPMANYEFGADGKMLQGIVEKSDGYYYYTNGRAGGAYGLMMIGDDYYFVLMDGKIVADQSYYAWTTSCDLPTGTYEFGADGKMVRGIVEMADGYYYYANGKLGSVYGLVKIDGDYYFVLSTGKLVTDCSYYAWVSNCDLPVGTYEFGADGKLLNGFIEKSDGTYYYYNGRAGSRYGLIYVDGYYYFVLMDGKLIKNQTYHVWEGNGLLVEQKYTFDELGRLVY